MASFRYFTRTKAAEGKKALVPIFIRLKHGGADLTIKSGFDIHPDYFNNETQRTRTKAGFTNKDDFDKDLRDLRSAVLDKLAQYPGRIDKEWLQTTTDNYHNPPEEVYVTLFSFIQEFIAKAPVRINPKTKQPVCYKQIREYERTSFYLKEFAKVKEIELDFSDIDLDFYDEFVAYLQRLNLAQNTIGKKIQTLKIFLNAASEQGFPVNPLFKSRRFQAFTEAADTIYLNESELKKIYKLDLSERPGLDRVRDLFIVGCWTGLRFSDWGKVTMENIDGEGFLELKQEKTGYSVVIPLHYTVQEILDKYHGVLPKVLTNQKFNEFLKVVAKKAELKVKVHKAITKGGVRTSKAYPKYELVTTHTARRSFATNLYKAGLSTYTIMQVTGHKTETSFLKYIKVTPREHAEKLKQFWHDQNKLKVVS